MAAMAGTNAGESLRIARFIGTVPGTETPDSGAPPGVCAGVVR